MNTPIIIIGSGFGAYQLVKTIRRTDKNIPISVFTLDAGHDYSKPDLSHVFTQQQNSEDLIRMSGDEFADTFNIRLFPFTQVDRIDCDNQHILVEGVVYPYSKLVLATGAKTFIPAISGDAADNIITLNSLPEFEAAHPQLQRAQGVLVIGGGLIGTEIAMDLVSSGKNVLVVDPSKTVMANMLPDLIANQLRDKMIELGVDFKFGQTITSLEYLETGIRATLSSGEQQTIDCVISAAGLKANISLAAASGLTVKDGVVVNQQLQTSAKHVYALGDCAEINGKVMSYLQPIMLSANALAKTLLGEPTDLKLPAMLVKVKTPHMPIQLSGHNVIGATAWQVDIDTQGCSLTAYDNDKNMLGFIVTEGHMKHAFPLLRSLPATQ